MNAVAYGGGFALGVANAIRHRLRGYDRPRPFAADDIERSVAYAITVARRWQQYIDVRGKRVLELGPGPDLGTGAVLLADGAASYQAVDAFPLAQGDLSRFFDALSARIGPVDERRLGYTIDSFPSLPEVHGDYDVVLSHATLEHIEHISALFQRLRDLAPRGVMCHQVDPITHIRWIRRRDPWNILRYGDRVYSLMRFPGAPNRMLAGDYEDAARRAGFPRVIITPHRVASEAYLRRIAASLPARFAAREDLPVLDFTLVAS
jgi:hypothetical protein